MEKKLKSKWVRALRSGKYKQGKGSLKHKGRFCCLGVLADIQGVDWEKLSGNCRVSTTLPSGYNARLKNRTRGILAARNDGTFCHYTQQAEPKSSFREIADYIEANL